MEVNAWQIKAEEKFNSEGMRYRKIGASALCPEPVSNRYFDLEVYFWAHKIVCLTPKSETSWFLLPPVYSTLPP